VSFLKEVWTGIRVPLRIIIQDFILVIVLFFLWFIIAYTVKILFPDGNQIVTYLEQASGTGSFVLYIIFLLISLYNYYKKRR